MGELNISANSVYLDSSVDSGICLDSPAEDLKKKLQEFKRILFILERDKDKWRTLRQRLGSLAARNSSGKPENEEFCTVCFSRLDLGEFKTCTQCSICSKFVCRGGNKCSEWFPKEGEWKCRLCSGNHTSGWIEDHYGLKKTTQQSYQPPLRARSEIYIPLCDPSDSAFLCNFESISEAPSSMSAEQKYQIREYIEEVMEDILGGTLETTPVGPLSKSDHYAVTGRSDQELRNVSGLRLRRLIESIIAETIRMPSFQPVNAIENQDGVQHQNGRAYNESACNGTMGHYFEPKSYHDLLATAVLNKIVETHGNRGYSESSPNLTTSLDKNHNDLFNAKGTESIITSCSAEPRSESGISESIRNTFKEDETSPDDNFFEDASNDNIEIDRESVLSDFISTHVVPLPHITTDHTSEEEDEDFISVASSGRDQTWEDNWLFKKKKANKTSSTIGMLVPAPKEDIRALIGDKPTDEVSDLSEMESDTDESSLEMSGTKIEPLNDRVASQHLIGGKNTKDVLDELLEQNSLISISSLPENVPKYTETKNEFVKADDADEAKYDPNETVNIDVAKKVSENNLSKPVLEMPNETTKHSSADFTDDEKLHLMSNLHEEQNGKLDSAEEISNSPSPRSSINGALSGSIAEREYKKWYNAVDMPNNPYSVEALKRRLSGGPERVMDLPNISPCKEENPIMLMEHSTTGENDRNQEREYARYSRDYYINDAKHASGTSKRSSNNSLSPSSSNDNIVIESRTLAGVSSNIEGHDIMSPEDSEKNIYKATPVHVKEDETQQPDSLVAESIGKLSNESSANNLTTESWTPSEGSDTIRIYDLKKQETRLIKDVQTSTPKKSSTETRPSDLNIELTPTASPNIQPGKLSTPSSFKFLQPKRKLIDPRKILSIDQENSQTSPSAVEKSVIEDDVVQSLPSVKALARAFLLTSTHSPSWHRDRKPQQTTSTVRRDKIPEPLVPDTASQGSEDATIASDLSSLEMDPPNNRDLQTSQSKNSKEPPLIGTGCLKNNIAFFENLKNK